MAFTFRQLQYFVAVAEQGSVSGAAQNLSISQSSVTEAIKELESDLGVALFERHPRGLNITHKGHQFLRHATEHPRRASRMRAHAFQRSAGAAGGQAAISASPRWSPAMCCPTSSPAIAAPIPASTVTAIEDNGDYLEHLLIGGELDVAVMVISNLRDRMALQAEILEVSPYRLWLPLGHPLAGAEIISLADIASEPLIMLTVDEIEENTGKLLDALGAARTSPSAPARSRRCAASSPPAPASRCCPTSSTGRGRWKATASSRRDISGALPVVQVGMVWRTRLDACRRPARDFIDLAQAQRIASRTSG